MLTLMRTVELVSAGAMGKAARKENREYQMLISGVNCDFCGLPPAWVFPTRVFQITVLGIDIGRDDGQWKACDRCAGMVEARSWEALVNRCVDFRTKRLGRRPLSEDQVIVYMMQLLNNVDANRIGPKEVIG